MSEFMMPAAPEAREFLREIADEMVERFGVPRAEAVARINQAWGHDNFEEWPDLIGHEDPEHWAYGLYYVGNVPYWEPDAGSSEWTVKPAPPRDSPVWTLPPEA